ncbi:MAG TPA: type III pantothenate kinase [Solirubrobacterales bacterium]|nr:type III pantothenate kinase [Solirubrobacterales bacterium]
MLLTIDVGNTQTHLGAFDGAELVQSWRVATEAEATADELAVGLRGLLDLRGLEPGQLSATAIASVVPRLSLEYRHMCTEYLGHECLMVAPGVKTGMPVLLENPHELGADRLVNAVAAHERFGGGKGCAAGGSGGSAGASGSAGGTADGRRADAGAPCAVVDFGTAITVDAVSAAGEYLGGVIAPGVQISMAALSERAARLPMVDFAAPESVIGRTTQAGLQSGMVYGFAGAIDAIVGRVAAELGAGARFVATGGMASTIVPYCESIDEVDELLTLTGLRLIHERNS